MAQIKISQISKDFNMKSKDVSDAFKEIGFEKKNSGVKKPTKQQEINNGLKDVILDHMEYGMRYTITDLMKQVPELADLSNQRVSAIVRGLKESGLVSRVEEKRKAYFYKV